jgi:outer membrane lipoprotein SlyB
MPMRFMMLRALAAATMAFLVGGTIAFAQQAPRIRGEIETVDGATLSLKTRDGNSMAVKVADDARVSALVKASLADIKTDSFIGVAGMPQSDGSIEAFSIHIFLPAQRGVVPDRHGPWDARPGSTMTNAYVESAVQEKDANTLMVKYKDGEKKILVTPQTVISAVAPGDKSELKAGIPIIIMGSEKAADGTVQAKTLYIGRNVRPAM